METSQCKQRNSKLGREGKRDCMDQFIGCWVGNGREKLEVGQKKTKKNKDRYAAEFVAWGQAGELMRES